MNKGLLVVSFAALCFLGGCKSKEAAVPVLAEPIGADMDTAVVARGDIYELSTYDAKIYPDVQEVSFNRNGVVKDIKVYLGQEVHKGDVLIQYDDEALRNELASLENELKDNKINNQYSNMQRELDLKLLELGIKQREVEKAAKIEIAQMTSDYNKAKLELQQEQELQQFDAKQKQKKMNDIKTQLESYVLTAPSSGRVVFIKEMHRKTPISANETVVMISDQSKLHVQSEFVEEALTKEADQIYALIHGKEYEIEYQPLTSEEQIKMKNGQVVVESSYSIKNKDKSIAVGDYACICIKNKLKTNVITIPRNALYSDADGKFVYRSVEGEIERCDVETGMETKIQVEITSGLKEGDVVYVKG